MRHALLPLVLFVGCVPSEEETPNAVTNPLGELVAVEAGSFEMGASDTATAADSDERSHAVVLTHDFAMMPTEVTQSQWREIMGTSPAVFGQCDDCPVENITWYDAAAFANAVSEAAGLAACYDLSGCVEHEGGWRECEAVSVRTADGNPLSCEGYRLPTEAEWEFAARGGNLGSTLDLPDSVVGEDQCSFDVELSDGSMLSEQAWTCFNADDNTQPVAGLSANRLGLYDMAGNVFEWTWDVHEAYAAGEVVDPTGPSTGAERTYRGGDWSVDWQDARVSNREAAWAGYRSECVGLRLVHSL